VFKLVLSVALTIASRCKTSYQGQRLMRFRAVDDMRVHTGQVCGILIEICCVDDVWYFRLTIFGLVFTICFSCFYEPCLSLYVSV
jgi:hypothetical protein